MHLKTLLLGAVAAVGLTPAAFAERGADGEVKIIYWQAPSTLNPYLSGGTKEVESASLVLESLGRFTDTGELVPWLAAEIPTVDNGGVSEDLTSITWTLKDGVMWSDGTALTAADAVFTWQYCTAEGGGCAQASYFDGVESVEAVDDMTKTWGNPGLTPTNGDWNKGYSPMFKYEWEPTYEALSKYAEVTDGSPYDGVMMEYVNPTNNGPVMKTMGASMQLLRPAEHTKAHRHTGSYLYHVAKGSGHSIINGKRFDWKERDIFCVPSWAWHEHVNGSSSEDACLFCLNDLPVMRALGLYREQAFGDNNGNQPLI